MTKAEEIRKLKKKVRECKKLIRELAADSVRENYKWASEKVRMINQIKAITAQVQAIQPVEVRPMTNDTNIPNYTKNTIISNPDIAVDRCSDCNCSKRCK